MEERVSKDRWVSHKIVRAYGEFCYPCNHSYNYPPRSSSHRTLLFFLAISSTTRASLTCIYTQNTYLCIAELYQRQSIKLNELLWLSAANSILQKIRLIVVIQIRPHFRKKTSIFLKVHRFHTQNNYRGYSLLPLYAQDPCVLDCSREPLFAKVCHVSLLLAPVRVGREWLWMRGDKPMQH